MSIGIGYTVGPASWRAEVQERMLEYVSFVRFPFAKETPQAHIERAERLRDLAARQGRRVELIADLPGGKPRLSNESPLLVDVARQWRILLWGHSVPSDLQLHPQLPARATIQVPVEAAVGDGELAFQVSEVRDGLAVGTWSQAAALERRLALTIPGLIPRSTADTPQDWDTMELLRDSPFDWLALSFVQSGVDVHRVRNRLLQKYNWAPRLMAKVETGTAVTAIEDIAGAADGVMLARGDLALHVPPTEFAHAQETVLRSCRNLGVPCVAATGYLESMITATRPTRAELTDFDRTCRLGASGVLFAAETTIGRDPVAVVRTAQSLTRAAARAAT